MENGVVNSEHEAIANGKNNNLNYEPQKRQEQQTQAIIELTAETRNTTTNNNNNPLHTSLREYRENLYSSKSEPENLTRFYHQIHLTIPPNREDE